MKTSSRTPSRSVHALACASALALLAVAGTAHAQAAAPVAGESAMVRLIRGLVQSGALARDVGEALLAQAQTEAMAAQQAQRQATLVAPTARPAAEPGEVRVPYVPQAVRDQIRDEIKTEVMAQARTEGWAAPNETPEWSKRIRLSGDVRVRNESRYYAGGNSNEQINYAAINDGSAYDVNQNLNGPLPPLLNTRQDRKNQWRARARIGVEADISESTQAGVRLATGGDDGPVSTTQTLGGGLGKKSIWLDQAWLSHAPLPGLTLVGGRFGNPFVSTDLLYSADLNFDGVAARFNRTLQGNRDVELFGTLGVVPLEYSNSNFPSNSQQKAKSENKWLLGAQVGANWKQGTDNRLRGALAYYDFRNVSGELSAPCALYDGRTQQCSTDWARPAFMQKGNTLMLLRNIALNPNDPAATKMPQYFGLASKFQLLDVNLRWDTRVAGGYGLRLDGNYIRNLAYGVDKMFARAGGGIVNNFDADGNFRSGGNAYLLQATFGKPAPAERGDWNLLAGYKRIEPDAMPDGYNDSSFHGGGTNAKGYYVGGSYAFDRNTWFTGRWSSSRQVVGAPVSMDLLQLEINTRF
ncbi:putative porin [Pseudorhodoferax sp. LjRoot39]|uniref:putative porin n=1 Tax=Pseudorhodoferax sp. LjRoot39 TaxID=3342328 RepID=UPI003ECC3C38